MYDEIDRLEGEAEFRFAVAVPVAFVGAAAMFRVPQHGWALLCAGVVLGILLVIAGATVTRTAERTMVDLLVSGTIVLPVEQAIAELLQEAPVNAA
jgi:hypothetical protein